MQEQAKFLADFIRLWQYADGLGFTVTARELGRTPEQQAIYVRAGRSKTMASNHMRNCAIDLYIFNSDGKWLSDKKALQQLGDYWEGLDEKNSWGGNWKSFLDTPHFERRA
jgi:peptidoglycan L-alanyl-D-glutamate endopeptidase CwlK